MTDDGNTWVADLQNGGEFNNDMHSRGSINPVLPTSDFGYQFTTVAEKLDRARALRTGASSLSCPSAMGLYVCHQVHGSQLTVRCIIF